MVLSENSQLVLLGTGTPNADPERSGPAVAVIVNQTPYLVDCGPGVVRRAAAACERGVEGLEIWKLNRAFVTHLHSDHTAGYPDLILRPKHSATAIQNAFACKTYKASPEEFAANPFCKGILLWSCLVV